jgi:hypothetical protein
MKELKLNDIIFSKLEIKLSCELNYTIFFYLMLHNNSTIFLDQLINEPNKKHS